jgi:ABC-2 type transport system ATP-binding protein
VVTRDLSRIAPVTFPFSVPAMLDLNSITKRYGALAALDGVSLEVAAGEFFGLLGPNGAGKSTLMSLVAGLRAPDTGTITLDGQLLSSANVAARTALGLVPQHIALYEELSSEQNLRIFGELYGLRGKLLRDRVDEALAAVQLADRRREPVKTFSGGMQRRLNLAAALLHRPKVLLCDEPTVGVDPQSRHAIFEFLEQLNRDGLTVIYSTHYMEEATRLCSRIGIIDHGKILALGTLDELLAQLPFEEEIHFPANAATAPFAAQLAPASALRLEEGRHHFRPPADFRLSAFYQLAESHALPGRLFTSERPSLEAVFLHLTGRTLRE